MSDFLLFTNALRETMRPRRLWIALLLLLLPPALALGWRLLTPATAYVAGDVYDSLVAPFIFSLTLTILSVIYGTGIVSQEIEGKTIVYLLTRPYPRWRILLTKFLASLLVILVVTTVSTVLVALATYGKIGREVGILPDLQALWIGAIAYGSLFLLLGTALPRPLTYGLLFVFGWETWVPSLPGQFARVSIMTYLKALSGREITEDPQTGFGGNFLLAFAQTPQIEIPAREAWLILSTISFVCLLAAHIVFSYREYAPRDDSE